MSDMVERVALNLRLAGICHAHTHSVQIAQAAIAAMQADAAPGWVVGNGNGDRWRAWKNGNPFWVEDREKATRYARREDAEAVHEDDEDAWRIVPYQPVADRVSTSSPVDDRAAPETSGKLRDAVEVWRDIKYQTYWRTHYNEGPDEAAVAIIEQDREAVRAEQAAELAKFKALAETLVGKIELFRSMLIDNDFDFGEAVEEFLSAVEPALRQYKEARDAS